MIPSEQRLTSALSSYADIATILLFVLQVFFMPETTYNRKPIVPSRGAGADDKLSDEGKPELDQLESGSSNMHKRRHTFVQEMSLYSGTFSDRPFLQLALEPIFALASPVVLMAIATYGLAITLLVVIATGSGSSRRTGAFRAASKRDS